MDEKQERTENRDSVMPATLSEDDIEEAIQKWFDRGDAADRRYSESPQ